ncbi:cell wall anchor protein [Micromonospora sp. NPDC000207]|uniref:cell wall anchor protein n=1 Tax=Micromonospora sp. NPDC000207 TaxID=3154246 RepID=UPI003330A844
MIRLNSPLRRVVAVTAGALLGFAGAATIAATPASAHHPIIDGTGCKLKDGSVRVTWTVRNSERQWDAAVVGVWSPSATEVTNLVPGALVPKAGQGELVGEQTVPRRKAAELSVRLEWDKGRSKLFATRTGKAKVTGNCQEEQPPSPTPSEEQPSPEPSPSEEQPPSEEQSPSPEPSPSEEPTPSPEPSPSEEPSPTPSTPVSPTPSQPPVLPEPGEPTFDLEETCDQLTFLIDNPADGVEFSVTLTSEKGEVKTLDGVPGQKTSVSFDAYEGLKVTPSIGDVKDEVVVWEQPKDCEKDEEGGSGGGLPVTGAAAGGIAAGAILLLGAGAVLFVVARRRKLRFTA